MRVLRILRLSTHLFKDEMLKPEWMDDDFAHEAVKYTLTKVKQVVERHKKFVCLEPHAVSLFSARRPATACWIDRRRLPGRPRPGLGRRR